MSARWRSSPTQDCFRVDELRQAPDVLVFLLGRGATVRPVPGNPPGLAVVVRQFVKQSLDAAAT
jgi:hypothetical protein